MERDRITDMHVHVRHFLIFLETCWCESLAAVHVHVPVDSTLISKVLVDYQVVYGRQNNDTNGIAADYSKDLEMHLRIVLLFTCTYTCIQYSIICCIPLANEPHPATMKVYIIYIYTCIHTHVCTCILAYLSLSPSLLLLWIQ